MYPMYLREWLPTRREMLMYPGAWNNIMLLPSEGQSDIDQPVCPGPVWTTTSSRLIMVSTPRVDRNGQLIFEGDILSTECGRGPVKWSDELCGWSITVNRTVIPLGSLRSHRTERSSNIYLNPELMRGRYRFNT
jgi:hypothetical protein